MKKILIIFLGLAGIHTGIFAQKDFVTIIEERQSGKPDTIESSEPAIVDINSVIRLSINLAEVEKELFQFQGVSSSDSRLEMLRELNELLAFEDEIMDLLASDLSDPENFYKLNNLILDFLGKVMDPNGKYPDLSKELISAPVTAMGREFKNNGEKTEVEWVFHYLETKADTLRQTFLKELGISTSADSASLVFFRLGAFIKNRSGGRAIHVANFDNIDQGPYSKRKNMIGNPLSPEESDALEKHKSLADSLKVNFFQSRTSIIDGLKAEAKNLFSATKTSVKTLQTDTDSAIQEFENKKQVDTAYADAIKVASIPRVTIQDVAEFYESFSQSFNENTLNFSAESFDGEGLLTILGQIEKALEISEKSFNASLSGYKQEHPDKGIEKLDGIEKSFSTYKRAARRDISGLKSFLNNIRSLLNVFKKPYLESEKFSEKVKRFTAGNIPKTGFIELRYIPERKPGDEILIKAVLQRGNKADAEELELYRRYVAIERVNPHIKMSGSLILASPMNRTKMVSEGRISDNLSDFQFAPTYGIFMKWGSRKSHVYNDLIQFGIGLGFSSPDFSLDGTPEFGTGIMFTGFKDIIGGGVGWNFTQGVPYSFVGFNIPFSVGGLPFSAQSSATFNDDL